MARSLNKNKKDTRRGTMRAVAIDLFGGPQTLTLRDLPIPAVGPGEVLIKLESAGVGQWDPFEREGGYAEMLGIEPQFPYVLGPDGSRSRRCRHHTVTIVVTLLQSSGWPSPSRSA